MTRRKSTWVWLVMANDTPEVVFTSEELADDYCMGRNRDDRDLIGSGGSRTRVYYRWSKHQVVS